MRWKRKYCLNNLGGNNRLKVNPKTPITGVLTLTHLKMNLFILPVFFWRNLPGIDYLQKIDEYFFKKLLLGLRALPGVALLF